jgi:imidazolonepropionase-like amidohydrolase
MLVAPADPAGAMLWRRALEAALAFTGLLATRGIRFLAGSDVPCGGVSPGLSLWREMALLTQTGLTPLQALQAATGQPAAFLGKPELGRLRPGAFADLAFVQGNPLAGIPADPVIPAVIRAGRLYRREALLAAAANAVDTLGEDPPGQQWLAA